MCGKHIQLLADLKTCLHLAQNPSSDKHKILIYSKLLQLEDSFKEAQKAESSQELSEALRGCYFSVITVYVPDQPLIDRKTYVSTHRHLSSLQH